MATAPQFVTSVNKGTPATLTAANTALDGTGATGRALLFTAGASGSVLPAIRYLHKGTNVATVMRAFRNNGSDPEVAANNVLIGEITIATNTLSQVAASIPYEMSLNIKLASGERIYTTMGTAVAAGIHCAPMNGGDF
jgi:hypothetical protein